MVTSQLKALNFSPLFRINYVGLVTDLYKKLVWVFFRLLEVEWQESDDGGDCVRRPNRPFMRFHHVPLRGVRLDLEHHGIFRVKVLYGKGRGCGTLWSRHAHYLTPLACLIQGLSNSLLLCNCWCPQGPVSNPWSRTWRHPSQDSWLIIEYLWICSWKAASK